MASVHSAVLLFLLAAFEPVAGRGSSKQGVGNWYLRRGDSGSSTDTDTDTESWGNELSVYWQARGLALLAGQTFDQKFGGQFGDSFLKNLPMQHKPLPDFTSSANLQLAQKAVSEKSETCIPYPHECPGAWVYIRPEIQEDTQAAMDKFFQENSVPPPEFLPGDVLVHLRFEFDHPQQAWPARSVFTNHLPKDTKRIRILHQPYTSEQLGAWKPDSILGHVHQKYDAEMQHNIDTLLRGYQEMLSAVCTGCSEVITETGTQVADFAKIARAPAIFETGSTYGLWAALSNNVGEVYMSPHFHAGGKQPDIPGVHWFTGKLFKNDDLKDFNKISAEKLVEWIKNN